jgi:phage-related minor tail protein
MVFGFADGGMVSSPSLFRFADGGTPRIGLMGEAGPEAIMPLSRDAGRLGVRGSGAGINYAPTMNITANSSGANTTNHGGVTQDEAARFGAMTENRVRTLVITSIHEQMRPGGILSGAGVT